MEKEMIIRTDKLSVGYDGKTLIPDISVKVNKGEILVLIGPNGAGKSTILKTIASQLKKIAGTVYLGESDMDELKEKDVAKSLSILLTKQPSGEMMTVWDVVETGRYPYTGMLGIPDEKDREVVLKAIELVGLTDIKDCFFNNISDGQRQRVMFARAICQEPDVLILDEPTSYLDMRYKLELLSIVKKLAREKNIAVIISLHELDLAGKCADKIMCVRDGRIDRYGTIDEIFYRNDNYINELYNVKSGVFIEAFGSMELEKTEGEPKVFVIGGGGSAIPLFRKLQREGNPYAVGVINENDMEYPVASALASIVISEKPFEAISDKKVKEALDVMKKCEKVYCPVTEFGTVNSKNRVLFEYAKEHNMLEDM